MNNNLLIVGAEYYFVAKDIADDMGCFDGIGYIDDNIAELPEGTKSCGTVADLRKDCECVNLGCNSVVA